MNYDLRNASIRDFERFLFEHEVAGGGNAWYHQFSMQIEYDAARNAELFTQVFLNAGALLDAYTPAELEQGFWAMSGSGFDGNLNDVIWESEIDVSAKEALIASMVFMFRDLFSKIPSESACEMWWDSLAYDIHPMKIADPENNPDHKRIQTAMFEALCEILEIDNRDCQFAALHGLNHVRHPETEAVIRSFVEKHPELTEREIAYASACAHGKAL